MRLSIMSGMMILSSTANAALSATTANTIQGTEPTFKALSGENRLGFTVDGTFYSQQAGNIDAETSKSFNASLTFNDFAVKTLMESDFTVLNDYDDSDGDVAKASGAFTIGATTYRWLKADGDVIQPADYGKMIGCGSGYAMPLKLEITLANVQVHSEYGDPRDSVLTPLKKTYQINSTTGICYAKADLTWYGWNGSSFVQNSGSATPNPDNGGGYSSDFIPTKGFKASANPKFPTTGFPGAEFQLVMTGAQTDWTYAVPTNPGNGVSVDSNGNVMLISKPTGTGEVIVSATSKNLTPSVTHTYKFNPTVNGWFLPQGGSMANYATAKTKCVGAAKIPTRAELTNSPQNVAPEGWTFITNYYTRAIGAGVFGEWGSSWQKGYYWTQNVHTTGSLQFLVDSVKGEVNIGGLTSYDGANIVCRG